MVNVPVEGQVAPGFELVKQVFADSLARRVEWGGSICVWSKGQRVVDLWGGYSRRDRTEAWQADTIATVFSATKGLVALCFLMQAERGKFDYDEPIATYWPEFAANGKADMRVRTLLNHRSGLVGVAEPVTLDELEQHPERVADRLAAQTPTWQPDTDQGYHGVTYGLYTAELFRRISGESLGTFLAREIAGPLGADVYLGLPEELEPRVAPIHPATKWEVLFQIVPKLLFHRGTEGRVYRQIVSGGDAAAAFRYPQELGPRGIHNFNTRRVRALELPWGGGQASARGLCRVYEVLAAGGEIDGVRLVSAAAIEKLAPRQSWSDRDRVLRKPVGWSQGFLKEQGALFSPNPESFGHAGAGGALGWCDPIGKVAIGYVTGKMDHRIRSLRALALCKAVYQSLAA